MPQGYSINKNAIRDGQPAEDWLISATRFPLVNGHRQPLRVWCWVSPEFLRDAVNADEHINREIDEVVQEMVSEREAAIVASN